MPEREEPGPLSSESAEPLPAVAESLASDADAAGSYGIAAGVKRPDRRRRRRRTSTRQRIRTPGRHRTVWIFVLSAMLVAETIVLIVLFSLLGMREKDRWDSTLAIEDDAGELSALRPEFKNLEKELERMVKGRLPRLRPMQMDSVIAINETPVSNIVFTISGNNRNVSCEYKVLLSNPGPSSIQFQLDVLFFTRTGIEIGRSRIGSGRNSGSTVVSLESGEKRSYSSTAVMEQEEGIPAFFMFAKRAY